MPPESDHGRQLTEIDGGRLLRRIRELGTVGRSADGKLIRLAGSEADGAGRSKVVDWMLAAGLDIGIDGIGNIFGTWTSPDADAGAPPVMVGSHLDTVLDAGVLDGSYGVLAGLEVVETLASSGRRLGCPIVVASFTNEEGVRYAPDMLGSLVHTGGLTLGAGLATRGVDGSVLGDELERIGFAGSLEIGTIQPRAFLELHVEQGPILESEQLQVAAVDGVQGISWQRVTLSGEANHAGTTPLHLRRDACHAMGRLITSLRTIAELEGGVATVGSAVLQPNAINVIASIATLTVDLRHPDSSGLKHMERRFEEQLQHLAAEGIASSTERLARFPPVRFDEHLLETIEVAAQRRGLAIRRLTSGAGHDAQIMARIAPTAMIFVPSAEGISHNPREYTREDDLIAGASLLFDVVAELAAPGNMPSPP